jgi:streptomycin 6-kinase
VMIGTLWEKLERPCSDAVISAALTFADRRAAAFDLDTSVVVHGDPHPANTLRASARAGAESGYVFVDPDGFIADRAYDLGVALRDWRAELLGGSPHDAGALLRRFCTAAATETGVDDTAIWEWGFIQRVSTGLYLVSLGMAGEGQSFLDSAELLV